MNTRNKKNPSQDRLSRRAWLESLLFHGAKTVTTFASIGPEDPKQPPGAGE